MKLVITYHPTPKTIEVECPKEIEFMSRDEEEWTDEEDEWVYGIAKENKLQDVFIKIFKDNKINDVGDLDWLKEVTHTDIFDHIIDDWHIEREVENGN